MTRLIGLWIALALSAVLACSDERCAAASWREHLAQDPPPRLVAMLHLDTSGLKSASDPSDASDGVVHEAIRGYAMLCQRCGVLKRADDASIIGGLLQRCAANGTPVTLWCLGSSSDDGGGYGVVLRIRGGATDVGAVDVIKAMTHRASPDCSESQLEAATKRLDAGNSQVTTTIVRPGTGLERAISWAAEGKDLFVAIGQGALETGLLDSSKSLTPPILKAHRSAASLDRPVGDEAFAIYIDFNTVRRCWPEAAGGAPLAGFLEAMGISNARDAMLHGRLIKPKDVPTQDPDMPLPPKSAPAGAYAGPPLLAIEATWTSRAEKPGSVHRAAVTSSFWPASSIGMPPPAGRFVAVLRSKPRVWVDAVLGCRRAFVDPEAFDRALAVWARAKLESLEEAVAAIGPWTVVTDAAEKGVSPGDRLGVIAVLREESRPDVLLGRISDCLTSYRKLLVAGSAKQPWSIDVTGIPPVRRMVWGITSVGQGRALMAAFGSSSDVRPTDLADAMRRALTSHR